MKDWSGIFEFKVTIVFKITIVYFKIIIIMKYYDYHSFDLNIESEVSAATNNISFRDPYELLIA